MSTQAEGKEHFEEWLKIFIQQAKTEKTAAWELAKEEEEEEADNIDFVDLCEELEALEKRVMVQILHIQQAKLETNGGEFQYEEQLEEAKDSPAGDMAEVKLP
jgi:hypothetical protein